jgi:hypothetical protein
MTLLEVFGEVKDHRRAQGQRFPLPAVLTMFSMAAMSGAYGLREITDFFKSNEKSLCEMFNLKHGVPKFFCVRELAGGIDFEAVNAAFCKWTVSKYTLKTGDFVSLDGKSLNSTVQNSSLHLQDFVQIVSAFSHEKGLVVAQKRFRHKKVGEQEIVLQLVDELAGKGLVLTLDALHCQKKQWDAS